LINKIKEKNIMRYFFKKPFGEGVSFLLQGVIYSEMAKIDSGLATFVAVQNALLGHTIEKLGSE
jgi:acyl-CoA oxidase